MYSDEDMYYELKSIQEFVEKWGVSVGMNVLRIRMEHYQSKAAKNV